MNVCDLEEEKRERSLDNNSYVSDQDMCFRKKGRREKTRSDRIFGKRKSDFEMGGPVFIGDKKVAVAGGVATIPPAPSTKIATAPHACDTLTSVITTSPAIRSRIQTNTRKSTLGLRTVMMPTRSAALRIARRAALSLETSSSSSSDSASHTLESSFTASVQGTQISPEGHSHHSYEAIRSPLGTLTRALSLSRADLLPPHKRYRGTSATHSYESSDDGSPETHAESDMDSDIRADIEAVTATIATATVDGLCIEPVLERFEKGFEPGLAVVESKSEPGEAEADDEAEA
ncbi:hypothetical protein Tco_1104080 [Tanacetum coccineum]